MSPPPTNRGWINKFADAFSGLALGVRGQSSFHVHFVMTAAVMAVAAYVRVTTIEWCLLVLCITLVLTAEMFNSALEYLARAIDREHNPDLGAALDIGSAAVLVASLGAVAIGVMILGLRLGAMLGWWPEMF
ncbi:MAG: diacylglycerol kinase [Planctomycetes bacterium]|nr:diacylglycerol kinase [Planctomycetota bacterium]